jgi:transposase
MAATGYAFKTKSVSHERFLPPLIHGLIVYARYRISFVRERATLVNRVQKVVEGTNLILSSVVSNVVGVSSQVIRSPDW